MERIPVAVDFIQLMDKEIKLLHDCIVYLILPLEEFNNESYKFKVTEKIEQIYIKQKRNG